MQRREIEMEREKGTERGRGRKREGDRERRIPHYSNIIATNKHHMSIID